MKNTNPVKISLFIILLFSSCKNKNSVPEIDPQKIQVGGYVASRHEFINDPIKQESFGHWKLVKHLNYYYADKYEGEITFPYYIMFVNNAGFETEKYGIAVGPDDDVRYTKNAGKTWIKAKGGDQYCRFGIDIVDDKVAWHNGNGGVKYTLNKGKSWQSVSKIQCFPHISFIDKDTGWIASSSLMFSTIDCGKTFQQMKLPKNCSNISAISLKSIDEGYILDNKGILYKTKDFGKTWSSSSIGLTSEDEIQSSNHIRAAVRFSDELNGKIVISLPKSVWSLITSDGGISWNKTEIPAVRNRNYLFSVYLSRNAEILTLTSVFEDRNKSFILKYNN